MIADPAWKSALLHKGQDVADLLEAVFSGKDVDLASLYADVTRRLELLRAAGTEGVADLKVGLEKAWDAFRSEIGWKP